MVFGGAPKGQPGRLTYIGQASRLSRIGGRSNRVFPSLIVVLNRDLWSIFSFSIFANDWDARREIGAANAASGRPPTPSVVIGKYLWSDLASQQGGAKGAVPKGTASWARAPLGGKSTLLPSNEAALRGSPCWPARQSPTGIPPGAGLALPLNGAFICVWVLTDHHTRSGVVDAVADRVGSVGCSWWPGCPEFSKPHN